MYSAYMFRTIVCKMFIEYFRQVLTTRVRVKALDGFVVLGTTPGLILLVCFKSLRFLLHKVKLGAAFGVIGKGDEVSAVIDCFSS